MLAITSLISLFQLSFTFHLYQILIKSLKICELWKFEIFFRGNETSVFFVQQIITFSMNLTLSLTMVEKHPQYCYVVHDPFVFHISLELSNLNISLSLPQKRCFTVIKTFRPNKSENLQANINS